MRAQNTSSIGLFYKSVGMLWTVSDCEELVGLLTGDEGNVISGSKEKECDAMDKYIDA